jgi:hypothetical protein
LFRAPYSLHEKTGLSSIVIKPEEIEKFQAKDADPLKVKVLSFLPDAKENDHRAPMKQNSSIFVICHFSGDSHGHRVEEAGTSRDICWFCCGGIDGRLRGQRQ